MRAFGKGCLLRFLCRYLCSVFSIPVFFPVIHRTFDPTGHIPSVSLSSGRQWGRVLAVLGFHLLNVFATVFVIILSFTISFHLSKCGGRALKRHLCSLTIITTHHLNHHFHFETKIFRIRRSNMHHFRNLLCEEAKFAPFNHLTYTIRCI